ncbi:MAG: NAD(P)-dependent dehydrogenase (short-subunit alcohol dehydrogenase family) [Flavobacteriales bacterium]|jgi:NAD(P)-dependent dehydrogenase (short-subunit alcohol dehydrogenase family)
MSKNIFITGATRGLGRAIVQQLCKQGHSVYASGRDQELLDSLKTETGCQGQCADLGDVEQVNALFKAAEASLGHVDVLINNAGFNSRKAAIVDTTLDEFELQYAINLRAPYLLCKAALPAMEARGHGYIINIVSTVAKRSNATMGIYTAMKQGFAGLSDILMKEAQPHGIKVTAVYPGGINTAFREQERPNYLSADSAATMVVQLLNNPADVVVHELTFRPPVELE